MLKMNYRKQEECWKDSMERHPTCVSDAHILVHGKPFKEACSVQQKQSREHKIHFYNHVRNSHGHGKHSFNSTVSLYMASGNAAENGETSLSAGNNNGFRWRQSKDLLTPKFKR